VRDGASHPAERPPAWVVLVTGIVDCEELSRGQALAEAVEFSFLPLRAYIESGLEPGFLPVATELDMPDRLELGRLAELAAEVKELGVALHIDGPCEFADLRWTPTSCEFQGARRSPEHLHRRP
jgi:hypothetical protein